jgi:hypothetical protein
VHGGDAQPRADHEHAARVDPVRAGELREREPVAGGDPRQVLAGRDDVPEDGPGGGRRGAGTS